MKKCITLFQLDVAVNDPERNYERVEMLIDQTAREKQSDILVLPETWNTGFKPDTRLPELADENGERTKNLLQRMAAKHRVNIVGGSVATRKNGVVYNTSYVVDRTGAIVSEYDKIHGFTPAKEDKYFAGGDHIQHFELDGIPCSGVICYDIRFPELIRKSVLKGVDLFFVPAQWPDLRLRHWHILNVARAIENQMFLCAVNACGSIGRIKCAGNSLLLDPWGEEILHLGDTETIATGEIDLDILKDIRERINVFRDRKPDLY